MCMQTTSQDYYVKSGCCSPHERNQDIVPVLLDRLLYERAIILIARVSAHGVGLLCTKGVSALGALHNTRIWVSIRNLPCKMVLHRCKLDRKGTMQHSALRHAEVAQLTAAKLLTLNTN